MTLETVPPYPLHLSGEENGPREERDLPEGRSGAALPVPSHSCQGQSGPLTSLCPHDPQGAAAGPPHSSRQACFRPRGGCR